MSVFIFITRFYIDLILTDYLNMAKSSRQNIMRILVVE